MKKKHWLTPQEEFRQNMTIGVAVMFFLAQAMKIKNILPTIKKRWHLIHSGIGFVQGTGFEVEYETLEVWWLGKKRLRVITDITFNTKSEWMRDLKVRWKKDTQQQKLERKRD